MQRRAFLSLVPTAALGASTPAAITRLALGGDVMLSRWVSRKAHQEKDPSWPFRQIAPFFEDPYGVPAISPPWGTLNAVDLNKGEILWKVPLGEYPQMVAKGIRNTGAKNFGGPVLTAGGVIFIAATPDEKIRAFDKYSGKILWEHRLPAGGYATPSVYAIGGREYVVIAAGGGGKLATKYGDSILAFGLPDAATDTRTAK